MAFPFLFTFTILLHISLSSANSFVPLPDRVDNGFKTYIVHVKHNFCAQSDTEAREDWYRSFLPATIQLTNEPERLIHSYHNVLSGFAARLTEDEVKAMEVMEGFVSARPERVLHLKTTHTPNFLGLFPQMGVWKDSNFGNGTIIGVMDSGVLPTHPSFNDEGMPPPPAKWKGRCEFNGPHCNNKLIGARNLVKESFNDLDGHGTHTASTAAGAFVKDAEALGNAFGTAVGMAPYAHLAIYKVCSLDDCTETDVLAGLDHAVEDGVDVLSLSIGEDPVPFHENTISIGSFRAMQKGIFVSCAAGNGGPWKSSVDNDAPWILTVGASTIDRSIRATAKLGNGQEFDGESLFQPKHFPATLLPLVYAGANGKADSALCREGSLKGMDVKGKVVVCDQGGGIGRIEKGKEVKDAGGAAMIIRNDEAHAFSTEADAHVLPASHVSFVDGLEIMGYINSSSIPTATIIFKGTVIGRSSAPQVTAFSSRGPSIASPGILKPDIIGPGVNILAAWPFPLDNTSSRRLTFNIMSGTSMSCPHLSGIAALLKSSHPDWSPAAIKSAMMTTADLYNLKEKSILDQDLYPADLFATGSGHVNPSRANNPGLVYDIQPDDYIPYLCGLGYTDDQVTILTHRAITCANITSIPEGQLNYPSLSVKLGPRQIFTRTLTNVGHANSFYTLDIVAPHGVDVNVKPDKLHFSEINQKLTYSVTFTRTTSTRLSSFSHGFLKWVSLKHFVRTPISVTFG